MDEGLFSRYKKQIEEQKENKQDLIMYIKKYTGILLEDNEIQITKKEISLFVSSIVKQRLFQKNIEKILKERGFVVKK